MLVENSEIGALVSAVFGSERFGLCSDTELDEAEERLAVQYHDRLSDFLITFTYWQAVNGGLPNVAVKGNTSARAFEIVEEQWPEIKLGPNDWKVRFFGSNGEIICLVGEDQNPSGGVYCKRSSKDYSSSLE